MVDAKLQPPKSCGRLVGIGLQLALSSIAIRSSLLSLSLSLSLSSRPTTESGFTAALSPSRASIKYIRIIFGILYTPSHSSAFSVELGHFPTPLPPSLWTYLLEAPFLRSRLLPEKRVEGPARFGRSPALWFTVKATDGRTERIVFRARNSRATATESLLRSGSKSWEADSRENQSWWWIHSVK